MSKVSMRKKKNKKMEPSLKDKRSTSILKRKKQLDVKATSPNVFEMESFLDEEREEKLEIFHQKRMKRSSLPSISTLLLSNNKDSGISSLLNNSIERPQQARIQEFPQNGDIFSNTVKNLSFNHKEQFDKSTSSPSNRSNRKSHDYSISDMFSDGLSQKDNFEQEFIYASSSEDSEANLLPLGMTVVAKKTGEPPIGKKDYEKERKVEKKNLRTEESESNFLCTNFERQKQIKKAPSGGKMNQPLKFNEGFEKNKAMKKFSSTVVSSDKKDSGIRCLLYDSINKTRKCGEDGEHCTVCKDENFPSFPSHKIYQKSKDCSTSDMIEVGNSTREMIYDADSEKSEPYTVDIVLSECNLDYTANSEDLIDGSIEMINKRAIWYMDENNLMDNRPELIAEEKSVLCENTRMNYTGDGNLELSDLLRNVVDFNEKSSVIESAEAIKTSQNSFKSSDSIKELLNIGSQLSDRSKVSLTSLVPEIDFSQNYRMSFEDKKVSLPDSRRSSFGISQAMYVKQRSSFFDRRKIKDGKVACFELDVSIPKDVDEFRTEIHLPPYKKQNYQYTSKYEYNDSDKENEMQISCPQRQRTSHKDFDKEFMDSNGERSASFNSVNKSLKRRYPFDKNGRFLNIDVNDNRKKDRQTVKNVGAIRNTWSQNRHIPIDQISGSNSEAANISNENAIKHSSRFWKVSHKVQNFVKEWLDKEDEIDCKSSQRCVDRQILSSKRRWLDLNGEERENGIDIDPETLLSNYSCEYDGTYKIEHSKIPIRKSTRIL